MVLTAHGGVLDFYDYNTKGDSSISGAKVKDWLEKNNGVLAEYLYLFTTDGKHTEEVWPETNCITIRNMLSRMVIPAAALSRSFWD